jgi:proline iminopeptidase
MASPSSHPVYAHEDAFDEGFLAVGSIHKLYYSQYGKKDGKPGKILISLKVPIINVVAVLFLHGGPGGQTSKSNTSYFNPAVYRVVLFDQRGAGRSTPNAEIRENTTQHILDDIEGLRKHLDIPKWHCVFGGSWGSTLALLYAQEHPELVGSLIIRGIFTVRKEELDWSRNGAAQLFPDFFQEFVNYLPEEDRKDPIAGYYKLLTSPDIETRIAAAKTWNTWDMSIGSLLPNVEGLSKISDDRWSLAHAVLEAHYFVHGAWLEEGQILKKNNIDKIRHIPSMIIIPLSAVIC